MAQLENSKVEVENKMEELNDTNLQLEFNKNTPSYNYCPFLPKEISTDISKITLGPVMHQSQKAYSYKLYYEGKKILIETPIITCMFQGGIQKYRYPSTNPDKIIPEKYSIHLGFVPSINKDIDNLNEIKEFRHLLGLADNYAKSKLNLPIENYHSALRFNYSDPNKPPVLRVKIPNKNENLLIEIYDKQEEIFEPTYEEAIEKLKGGTEIKCILEINTLWKVGDKWGLSYKLVQVDIINNATNKLFRK